MTWSLTRHRLALGIEPLDAVARSMVARPVHIDIEWGDGPHLRRDTDPRSRPYSRGQMFPRLSRNNSGRHAVLLTDNVGDSLDVRIYDRQRRWVPRRLAIPLPDASDATATLRFRQPWLFPGMAWDLSGGATAVRSRVGYDGDSFDPVRWARIEARMPDEDDVVLRTQADDRGEFTLILDRSMLPSVEIELPLELDVRCYGPAAQPAPPTGDDIDPLWDLPQDQLANPGDDDPAARGEVLPAGWVELASATISFTLGRTISDQSSFLIP